MKLPSLGGLRLNQQMPHTIHLRMGARGVRIGVWGVGTEAGAAAGVVGAILLAAIFAVTNLDVPMIRAQTLPPTQPTSLPAGRAPSVPTAGQPAAQPTAAAPSKPRHAQVTYVGGQLDIRANDSSLNQILRSISRRTGLKITGGVADERVFGNYGPGPTSSVLATLLDGTDTNILLLEGDATNPPELILTPRKGDATPPSPDASIYAAYDDSSDGGTPSQTASPGTPAPAQPPAPAASQPHSIPQPLNNVNGSPSNTSPTASTLPTVHSVPLDSIPTPSTTPSTSGIVDSPNPPPAGSTTGSAPNGTQQSGQPPH